jgi:protein SCO1/2
MNTKRAILKALCGVALYPAIASARVAGVAGVHAAPGPRAGYFPNAEFVDQNNRKVRFYDDIIRGKLVVINMMYTECSGICPSNTANLLTVQKALGQRVGRDIHMVSISLQPEFDSPAALLAYAKKYDVKPGWTFLTGKRADMEVVRRKLGFYDTDPVEDSKLARHTGMVSIGNERIDRWCMQPSLTATHQLVKSILDMT